MSDDHIISFLENTLLRGTHCKEICWKISSWWAFDRTSPDVRPDISQILKPDLEISRKNARKFDYQSNFDKFWSILEVWKTFDFKSLISFLNLIGGRKKAFFEEEIFRFHRSARIRGFFNRFLCSECLSTVYFPKMKSDNETFVSKQIPNCLELLVMNLEHTRYSSNSFLRIKFYNLKFEMILEIE